MKPEPTKKQLLAQGRRLAELVVSNPDKPKWIAFTSDPEWNLTHKTQRWLIETTDGRFTLGEVKWFSRWRKYAFFPVEETVYEEDCLRDIANFCEYQTRVHKGLDVRTA